MKLKEEDYLFFKNELSKISYDSVSEYAYGRFCTIEGLLKQIEKANSRIGCILYGDPEVKSLKLKMKFVELEFTEEDRLLYSN